MTEPHEAARAELDAMIPEDVRRSLDNLEAEQRRLASVTRTQRLPMIRPGERAGYTEHAAWQSIDAHLRSARKQRDEWDTYVAWLRNLLETRKRQVAEGTWPPKPAALADVGRP